MVRVIIMKQKKKIVIPLAILLLLVIVSLCTPSILNSIFLIGPQITNSDIKKIELSNVSEIIVTNGDKNTKFLPEQKEFDVIKSVFDNKKVKIDDRRVHFWSENEYQIEFVTSERTYTLYGCPEIVSDVDETRMEKNVVFVLYDYTNNHTMEYLYQIVTISKDDFLGIFPESYDSIEEID